MGSKIYSKINLKMLKGVQTYIDLLFKVLVSLGIETQDAQDDSRF